MLLEALQIYKNKWQSYKLKIVTFASRMRNWLSLELMLTAWVMSNKLEQMFRDKKVTQMFRMLSNSKACRMQN